MTLPDLENQLIQMQHQLAFMEDTIDTLNTIVTAQSQKLADQQTQLKLLYQKIVPLDNASEIEPFNVITDRPPHY